MVLAVTLLGTRWLRLGSRRIILAGDFGWRFWLAILAGDFAERKMSEMN